RRPRAPGAARRHRLGPPPPAAAGARPRAALAEHLPVPERGRVPGAAPLRRPRRAEDRREERDRLHRGARLGGARRPRGPRRRARAPAAGRPRLPLRPFPAGAPPAVLPLLADGGLRLECPPALVPLLHRWLPLLPYAETPHDERGAVVRILSGDPA